MFYFLPKKSVFGSQSVWWEYQPKNYSGQLVALPLPLVCTAEPPVEAVREAQNSESAFDRCCLSQPASHLHLSYYCPDLGPPPFSSLLAASAACCSTCCHQATSSSESHQAALAAKTALRVFRGRNPSRLPPAARMPGWVTRGVG